MRNITCIICISLLIVASQACKKDEKNTTPKVAQSEIDTIAPSSSIVINLISDDSQVLKHFDIINYSNSSNENLKDFEETKVGDTTRITLHNVNQPQIMEFFGFGNPSNYNTRFLVSPNDTILMTIKEGQISFDGEAADNYNFFHELDPENNQWSRIKYTNATDYKNSAQSIYQNRKQFFNNYIKDRRVSNDFKEQVGNELRFEYLFNLISPRSEESVFDGVYINTTKSLYSVIDQQEVKGERIIDARSYFGDLTIDEFKRPELINNDYFQRSLSQYIRHYFTGHEFLNYSLQNFEKETGYIEANLTGKLRQFAITEMISDYYKNGLGRSESSLDAMKNLIEKYKDEMTNSIYADVLSEIENKLKNLNTDLPQPILEEKLVSIEGDTLSLKQVLAANQNKVKVIDFWASWCKPCVEEIQKVKSFKQDLSNTNDVNWIFISIDHDVESWKSMSNKLQEFGLLENQYRIVNRKESDILNILDINMIPRYIIISKTDKIISEKAPKPSDTLRFKKFIE